MKRLLPYPSMSECPRWFVVTRSSFTFIGKISEDGAPVYRPITRCTSSTEKEINQTTVLHLHTVSLPLHSRLPYSTLRPYPFLVTRDYRTPSSYSIPSPSLQTTVSWFRNPLWLTDIGSRSKIRWKHRTSLLKWALEACREWRGHWEEPVEHTWEYGRE